MRKTNCFHLLLAAAALAALPLLAVSAHAAQGDIYETNGTTILRFLSIGGSPSTFANGLSNPKGLVFDGSGRLYVADANRGAITMFSAPGGGSLGDFASNLSSPVGLTFDSTGNLFVGESGNGNITRFGRDNTRTTFASGLGGPAGLVFSRSGNSNGNLFVSDFSGGKIYQITPAGVSTTFASGLSFPAGLAFDSAGNLFEADSGSGTILKFAPDGTRSTFATGLTTPFGVAIEETGNLIVSDNGNGGTFRYTPAGVRTVIFSSDFNTPQFVAIEPAIHQLLNISTRGFIDNNGHLLIAGFIIGGIGPIGSTVVVRALGPSLSTAGIPDPLADPLLGVRDAQGTLVSFNDNFRDAPLGQRVTAALAPTNDLESALQLTLLGGSYTAIVTSSDGGVGTALVEVYLLQQQ